MSSPWGNMMNSESRNTKFGPTSNKRILINVFRIAAISICGAYALLLQAAVSPVAAATPAEVTAFGSNPGNLRMFKFVPDALPASSPLVVVMHGCKQNARDFARD